MGSGTRRDGLAWRVERRDGETRLHLEGILTEHADFGRLLSEITGRVAVDLAGVRRMNSVGIRRWMDLVTGFERKGGSFSLERCAPVIVRQLNMIARFEGAHGEVRSVFAPYLCPECETEHLELIELELADGEELEAEILCSECGAVMVFDDLPATYFAFLKERRVYARVETEIPCEIAVAGRGTCAGTLRNLSQGGALVLACEVASRIGTPVTVRFHFDGVDGEVTLEGQIVRIDERGAENYYGVRVAEDGEGESLLRRVVELVLQGTGVGRRAHPRVYRALQVELVTLDSRTIATVRNLSRSGMRIECRDPVAVGEQVAVEVVTGPAGSTERFTGKVIHERRLAPGVHDVGMAFAPLGPEGRARIEELIHHLALSPSA